MSLISLLKRPKKMSLNHWRYRLMHWAFGQKVKNEKDIEHSLFPMFLYTHYCPLFHFSNFLLLLLPVTCLVKLVIVLASIGRCFVQRAAHIGSVRFVSDPRKRDLKNYLRLLQGYGYYRTAYNMPSFKYIWSLFSGIHLDEREAEEIYWDVIERMKQHERKKEAFRERIILWIRIGEVLWQFTCWGCVGLVGLLFIICVCLLVWKSFIVLAWLLPIILSDSFLIARVACVLFLVFGTTGWVFWGRTKRQVENLERIDDAIVDVVCFPIELVGKTASRFYHSNCPPIELVELNCDRL